MDSEDRDISKVTILQLGQSNNRENERWSGPKAGMNTSVLERIRVSLINS